MCLPATRDALVCLHHFPHPPQPFSVLTPPLPLAPPSDNEGWFFGTSHNTGTSGLYPGNYVEKTKESDCWVLHRWVGKAGV